LQPFNRNLYVPRIREREALSHDLGVPLQQQPLCSTHKRKKKHKGRKGKRGIRTFYFARHARYSSETG